MANATNIDLETVLMLALESVPAARQDLAELISHAVWESLDDYAAEEEPACQERALRSLRYLAGEGVVEIARAALAGDAAAARTFCEMAPMLVGLAVGNYCKAPGLAVHRAIKG
jgi:hypothetical protein